MIQYPIDNKENAGYITFVPVRRIGAGTAEQRSLPGSIKMYIPNGLQFSDGISISGQDLGAFGVAAANVARSGFGTSMGDLFLGGAPNKDALAGITAKMAGSVAPEIIGGLLAKISGASALVGLGIGSLVDTSTVNRGIDYGQGQVFNPHTKALFDRVSIRNFSFQFNMIPTSQDEANAIKQIVKIFRTQLYPETVAIGDGTNSYEVFMKYPDRWDIRIYPNGEPSDVMPKFKPCYLQSVSTSYNSTSTSFHEKGDPVETLITLSFIEEETLSKRDVEGGY